MAKYLYRCPKAHECEIEHPIAECDTPHLCPVCGFPMHRVPQVHPVNWGGLPPHLEGTRSRVTQDFITTAPERRARYLDTERKK